MISGSTLVVRANLVFYFLCCLLASQPIFGQRWMAGIKASGSTQRNALYEESDIAVDVKGNIVIAGHYNNILSLGPYTITTDNGVYSDIFLCSIRADQTVNWLKHIETGFNYGDEISVALDDDCNIYLTGMIDSKIFASKYNSNGTAIWQTDFGVLPQTQGQGYGTSIKTDSFNNVYVSGGTGWNFFIAKLSFFGKIEWVKNIWVNYSEGCTVSDIEVDRSGNIYFVGKFEIDLPLDNITLEYPNNWGPCVFWGKMDTNGKFIWAKSGSGRSTEKLSISLTSSGHLMIAGGVSGNSISLGSFLVPRGNCCNGPTTFLAKSDLNGNVIWAKSGTQNYYGSYPIDTEVDHQGNLYLTGGYFTCYGTFCSESDYFVEKYDPDGVPVWRLDYASRVSESTTAIDIDNNGLLYQLGVNSSPTSIDPNQWVPTLTYGVGIMDTQSGTYKKTPRPRADRLTIICESDPAYQLGSITKTVGGENVRWYDDAGLSKKVGNGISLTISSKKSDTVYVTQTIREIESWPQLVIIQSVTLPNDALIFEDNNIRAPKKEGITYQWYFNNTPINGANTFQIKVDTAKNINKFSVLISQGRCEKRLSEIQVVTNVIDREPLQSIAVYPNPTSSSVIVKYLSGDSIPQVRIFNLLGIELDVPFAGTSTNECKFDLALLPSGVYILEVKENKTQTIHRIIKL